MLLNQSQPKADIATTGSLQSQNEVKDDDGLISVLTRKEEVMATGESMHHHVF